MTDRYDEQGRTFPAMSVVLATPGTYETIRTTISHLRRQSVCDQLELVIVTSSSRELSLDETELADFASFQVVEVGVVSSVGIANARGVEEAKAPIVVLAEDHAFPQPNWAVRLMEAHAGPWAAVGPGVQNANPATMASWADLFIGYGPWVVPAAAGEAEFLPGHNTSYKRDRLLAYGDELGTFLQAETLLHWDLRAKGHRLYFEPRAVVAHTNFSLWSSWLRIQFFHPRVFGAERARGMSAGRRCLYIVGSPLIPFVRLARIARQRRPGRLLGRFLWCLPALMLGLAIDALGQLVGYAFGAGDALEHVARYEFFRVRHITKEDRQNLFLPASDSSVPAARSEASAGGDA